ncbi:hypothetical protein pb186bvf_015026 [Paramecium bursaria]
MDQSSRIQSHYKLKDLEYDRFFETLTLEYKLLKKLTHQCQMNCFDNSQLNIKQSENCARKCLDPYLSLRKQMQEKLSGCQDQFQQREPKCLEEVSQLDRFKCKIEALSRQLKVHNQRSLQTDGQIILIQLIINIIENDIIFFNQIPMIIL